MKVLKFGTKNTLFRCYGENFRKKILSVLRICLIVKFPVEIKISNLRIFCLNLKMIIVIFEINALKFVLFANFVQE